MKNIAILFCLLIGFSWVGAAQDYSEFMNRKKEIFTQKNTFKITIDQKVYQDEVSISELNYKTEIYSKGNLLFYQTPQVKVIQNLKSYTMVREDQEIILYSPFSENFDIESQMEIGLNQWQASLNTFVNNAISIERIEKEDHFLFEIITKNDLAKMARVKFSKENEMMIWMDLVQIKNEKEVRLEYFFDYDFESPIPNYFDEGLYLSNSKDPKGVGKYANYEVVFQPIE